MAGGQVPRISIVIAAEPSRPNSSQVSAAQIGRRQNRREKRLLSVFSMPGEGSVHDPNGAAGTKETKRGGGVRRNA